MLYRRGRIQSQNNLTETIMHAFTKAFANFPLLTKNDQ